MNIHEKYINRCIQLGKNGLGTTAPNPMVGCTIVCDNQIIGEGFTSPYGGPHAEINAINNVKDRTLLEHATMYVTLEPCSHYGKTPPCADAIIRYKIPKIVIGTLDIHNKVAGQGIEKLRAAGCEVIVGVLEKEAQSLHQRFFMFHNKKRPYVILKWAQTTDGFIAPKSKNHQKPVWITNDISRQLVHKWRSEEQAILVGTHTVIDDNPSLTVRDWTGKNPIRIVLDRQLRLPKNASVFNEEASTIVICDKLKSINIHLPQPTAKDTKTSLAYIDYDLQEDIAEQICTILYNHDINSVIIEGGRHTLQTFIDEDLWDEARVFYGDVVFSEGIKAPEINGTLLAKTHILDDTLKIYKND